MATINTPELRHGELRVVEKSGVVVDFKPFFSITSDDKRRLVAVQRAVFQVNSLDAQHNLYNACNLYFRGLPRGQTLRALWQNGGIWINFWPDSPRGEAGVTHGNNRDITIASWCLDTQTTSMVAATIIHEVAHIAGAPGARSHQAEKAVDKCGFHSEYQPQLLGSLELFSYFLGRMG